MSLPMSSSSWLLFVIVKSCAAATITICCQVSMHDEPPSAWRTGGGITIRVELM